jgi:hypothetical protein
MKHAFGYGSIPSLKKERNSEFVNILLGAKKVNNNLGSFFLTKELFHFRFHLL